MLFPLFPRRSQLVGVELQRATSQALALSVVASDKLFGWLRCCLFSSYLAPSCSTRRSCCTQCHDGRPPTHPPTVFAFLLLLVVQNATKTYVHAGAASLCPLANRYTIGDKHKGTTPACRAVLSAVKFCVSGGDGVPSTPVEDLPFARELRSGGSDSTRALHQKVRRCSRWLALKDKQGVK